MIMSRDQDAGRSHSIKIDNRSLEIVEDFKYWGGDHCSIPAVIKRMLKSGNACYHSVHNLLSSSVLSENLKMKIYRIIFLDSKLEDKRLCTK